MVQVEYKKKPRGRPPKKQVVEKEVVVERAQLVEKAPVVEQVVPEPTRDSDLESLKTKLDQICAGKGHYTIEEEHGTIHFHGGKLQIQCCTLHQLESNIVRSAEVFFSPTYFGN